MDIIHTRVTKCQRAAAFKYTRQALGMLKFSPSLTLSLAHMHNAALSYIVPLLFGYDATVAPDIAAGFTLPFSPVASPSAPSDADASDMSVLFKVWKCVRGMGLSVLFKWSVEFNACWSSR